MGNTRKGRNRQKTDDIDSFINETKESVDASKLILSKKKSGDIKSSDIDSEIALMTKDLSGIKRSKKVGKSRDISSIRRQISRLGPSHIRKPKKPDMVADLKSVRSQVRELSASVKKKKAIEARKVQDTKKVIKAKKSLEAKKAEEQALQPDTSPTLPAASLVENQAKAAFQTSVMQPTRPLAPIDKPAGRPLIDESKVSVVAAKKAAMVDERDIKKIFSGLDKEAPETESDMLILERTKEELYQSFRIYSEKIVIAKEEIEKVIKGQEALVNSVLRGFICHGNILLESLPGLGKTVLCRCLAKICDLKFNRIQFTTDLLPSDIIGFVSYDKVRGFETMKGPIFCNLMLADEINRAPPKVQSALLEAMGERQVTLSHETIKLDDPFLVLATQNPLEQSGTFPLPEAQIDRFMFKVVIDYPDFDSEYVIMEKNLSSKKLDQFELRKVLSIEDILIMQSLTHYVHVEPKLRQYILNIIRATRNPYEINIKHAGLVSMGGSPRASIALFIASKAQALMNGRHYVIPQDIHEVVYEVMRHRVYLNFHAKMENISTDDIIKEIIDTIKIY